MSGDAWWKSAVIYQIYPRSFATADPGGAERRARIEAAVAAGTYPTRASAVGHEQGVGDLEGIRERLDHLVWLGVDAIWLSPFFPSPMADFGYDVSDYCGVDPAFGTLDQFDQLLADAHERGLRVLIDWVPNHTSDQHPWFRAARSGPDDPKRDWYVWRDGDPATVPNNWRAALTDGPAWTFDDASGQWYLHLFLPEQPDLNWRNPAVEAAMHDTLRFWLDRGVDGFRMDVVHCIGKAPDLPDNPPELAAIPHSALNHDPFTHELLRRIRGVLGEYDGDRMMVGEVFLLDTAMVATYYGDGDELHLSFNFPPLFTTWRADKWERRLAEVVDHVEPRGGWPTWVLSNHDVARHRSRYGSEQRARAAAVLLLTLRGTPFLFAGEELGLEDADVLPDRVVDPGGRDGCRAPIPWDPSEGHGWGLAEPWLPWPPAPQERNVENLRADPASILHLYRHVLSARRGSPALRLGRQVPMDAPAGVLCWRRDHEGDSRIVAVNFTAEPVLVPVEGIIEVASDGAGQGQAFSGTLGPDQAVVLRPQ